MKTMGLFNIFNTKIVMHKNIRNKPIEKPIIPANYTLTYKEEENDNKSDYSFLKLTEDGKDGVQKQSQYDSFQQMELLINRMESKSKSQLQQIEYSIGQLIRQSIMNSNIKKGKKIELIDENKENLRLTYRNTLLMNYEKDLFQNCTFQIDQNKNFIKEGISGHISRINLVTVDPMATEQLGSLVSSRTNNKVSKTGSIELQKQSTNMGKQQIRCRSQLKRKNSDLDSERNNQSKSKRNQSGHFFRSVQKQKAGNSVSKRGRIYEQILSRYSTKKLLAMKIVNN